jgi:pimeloyl-ACP methyl ester carboxylesterase
MSPVSAATHHVPSSDGVTLALLDLGGAGPPLLFCHPTGFHGMTWAPLAAHLATAAHSWAVDLRGHGDSSAPGSMDFAWRGMADDVLAVVAHLTGADGGEGADPDAAHGRGPGIHAVGHSMGGTALLMAELRRPGTFAGLWLFEPIVPPRLEGMPTTNPMADAARRRRPWFPDRDTAYTNFAAKPPLAVLDPQALRAYVDHGLRERPDGTVELKCTPEVEARVFEGSMASDTFAHLGEIGVPVIVAASGDDGGPARLAPLIADALPRGRLERYPHLTHFGPMEDPPGMAAAVRAGLGLV